jgi:hypothetical protein
MAWGQRGQSDLPRGLSLAQEGQSDLLRGLNPQEIQLGVGTESQIFSELESPGDMDSDFSGGRGKDPSLMWSCGDKRGLWLRRAWYNITGILVTASSSYKALRNTRNITGIIME